MSPLSPNPIMGSTLVLLESMRKVFYRLGRSDIRLNGIGKASNRLAATFLFSHKRRQGTTAVTYFYHRIPTGVGLSVHSRWYREPSISISKSRSDQMEELHCALDMMFREEIPYVNAMMLSMNVFPLMKQRG
jgi:hypothetical protein